MKAITKASGLLLHWNNSNNHFQCCRQAGWEKHGFMQELLLELNITTFMKIIRRTTVTRMRLVEV